MPELDVNYIRSQRLHFAGGLPHSFKLTVTSFLTQKLPEESLVVTLKQMIFFKMWKLRYEIGDKTRGK